ncbi:hypothetical protein [Curtobacterium sp. VKM Ac-2922]|uniref:hypothetical protein n=1 Tax=Curtobacterium sp. VKM Ac-2922 TaxID=2929475 RepID=UPI001FB39243|nr:hypothetical protein [Curtobacterium sp. VKM Ac-2922]MCJ1713462.1 hypothetical protein [Curtobacterium sp. VKM Ac-2922]
MTARAAVPSGRRRRDGARRPPHGIVRPPAGRTAQQYDPLGAMGARPLAVVLGAAGVLWGIVTSVFDRDVVGSPTLSAMAVLLLAASAAVVLVASSPFRAPFPRWAFVLHVGLLAAAAVSSVAAQWGPDRNALNDFMALLTATGIVMAAPYRPWVDLVVGGVVLAVVDALAWGTAASVFPHGVPVSVAAFLAAAPTLVLTVAAGVFAWTFSGLAERVQIRAGSYSVERAERDGIAASVEADRSTILARDVGPFFAELRTRETITDADRNRARSIADGIRRAMVADADRTWFEQAVRADGGAAAVVDDPDGLIATLDTDQRTVVRTVVRAVLGAPTVDPAAFRATVRPGTAADGSPSTDRVSVALDVGVDDSDVGIHRTFDPYFAVLRVTFPDLDVAVRPSSLALRFSYDQH